MAGRCQWWNEAGQGLAVAPVKGNMVLNLISDLCGGTPNGELMTCLYSRDGLCDRLPCPAHMGTSPFPVGTKDQ